MNRSAEAAFLIGASALAAFGIAMANLAGGGGIDAQVALTFLVFLIAFGGLHLSLRQWAPRATAYLLPLVAIITAVGFTMVYRLDPERAGLQRWWLLIAAGLAVGFLFAVRSTGLEPLRRYRYLLLLGALVLLILPLLPADWPVPLRGKTVNGSRLWVEFAGGPIGIQFQPGEFAKLLLVIFLASYLAERNTVLASGTRTIGRLRLIEPRQLVPVLVAWTASFGVLVYQRDLGASLLLFAVFLTLLFMATGRAAYPAIGSVMFVVGALFARGAFAHVDRRLVAWLDPFSDFEGAGYQIAQGLFAMGSGSLSGSGIGLGRPDLIPFAQTDFVFAAVGEELGLAGSVVVLCAYALLTAVGFGIALRSRDLFRKLLAAGLTFALGLQTFLIIGGVVRILPLTGITLPFMSYGGSSLVSNLVLIALLARLSHEEPA
ncbi:MAG: FtsW/RodA/SpoVE family cell cycle protein [Acidimicrobiia bacterium]|nr:FtsW/RodA/SpoVE family cell cycle protein [Acidimicrobiia bacterium]